MGVGGIGVKVRVGFSVGVDVNMEFADGVKVNDGTVAVTIFVFAGIIDVAAQPPTPYSTINPIRTIDIL